MLKLLEQAQSMRSFEDLPPIPQDCVRLTHHFASDSTAEEILAGAPFLYRHGKIDATTDSFSDNKELWQLITTGKTGAFSRSEFGHQVMILDIPFLEYRQHLNPRIHKASEKYAGFSGEVDNSRILGVFDKLTMTFRKNLNYNPNKPLEEEDRKRLFQQPKERLFQQPKERLFQQPKKIALAPSPATVPDNVW